MNRRLKMSEIFSIVADLLQYGEGVLAYCGSLRGLCYVSGNLGPYGAGLLTESQEREFNRLVRFYGPLRNDNEDSDDYGYQWRRGAVFPRLLFCRKMARKLAREGR